jgi:type IV pilus assembly protein PilQ
MKGHILIPLLSLVLVAPAQAQETAGTPAPISALQRATQTIDEVDQQYHEREDAVLGESPEMPEVDEAPAAPTFAVPEGDVLLDLPGEPAAGSVIASDEETISVDFPAEDVRDIIRSVADLYELNVVIPDSLAGSVSIKLRNVTWQQVFSVVLEPLNFTYIMDGNIIKIMSREELAVEPVDTRVFIVDFAKAAEIRSSVEPMIDASKGGRIQVDERSNALVITERPSRMNDIQEIIETLDRPTEQVMIESKFVEITGRESDSIGVDWQSLIGYRLQVTGDGDQPLGRLYQRTDGRSDTPLSASQNNFSIANTNGQTTTSLSQTSTEQNLTEWIDSVSRTDTAVFSADAFSVVLSALETNTNIELVSNPTIVTMNNKRATINIGEEFPIPSYRYNDEQGTFEVSDFEYKNIGINLNVTPQINSAGFINLDIQPEISSRSGQVEFGGASGAVIPIITTRKTNSSVTIKSGYTLAIGGLIEERGENRDSKVPVLGSIPGVGRFFSSKGKQVDKRNLIVFITAKILSASGATYRDVFSQRTLFEMGISSSDVPGYESPPEEKEMFDTLQQSRDEIEQLKTQLQLQEKLHALESLKHQNQAEIQKTGEADDSGRVIRRRYQ